MPIYGYGVSKAPWSVIKEMKRKELAKYVKIVRKVARKEYGLDEYFLRSLEYNIDLETVWAAKYDLSKCNMNEFTYQTQIEKLIELANKEITNKEDIKFDIAGTWVIGEIILMRKNKTE